MSDIIEGIAGNQMLRLKQELKELRERLAACLDEGEKKAIRREIMNKETHYNILADRQRLNH